LRDRIPVVALEHRMYYHLSVPLSPGQTTRLDFVLAVTILHELAHASGVVNELYYGYGWAISTTLRPNPAYATSCGEALGMRYSPSRNYDRKFCSHGSNTTVSGL
jgi:hypothetical protein